MKIILFKGFWISIAFMASFVIAVSAKDIKAEELSPPEMKVDSVTSSDTVVPEQTQGSLLTQETLTGDWGGLRDQLAEKGIKLDIEFTEYYQGMFSGTGYDDFDFGGRADALVNFDTKKLGLWDGGGFHTHLTYRFGGLPASRGGALWPVSTGSILPLGEEDNLVASSLYVSQRFGDSGSLLLGKINAVDLLANDPFYGGWGNHRFMNMALVAPPSGVLPPVIIGAISNYRIAPFTLTFMVYDPHDRTGDYWPDDLFSDEVNLSLGATWTGNVFERPSSINLTGIYSTEDKVDLSEIALPPDLQTETEDGAYNVSLKISHLLLESPIQSGQGLGLYGKAAIADGNPNPIEASFSGGIAGHRIVPGRPHDVFGIGYFFYDFSEDLKNAISPLLNFDNEQGVEIFYNLAVTPWFRVTADLQWIDPALDANDHAWIGALRTNVKF
ncbi:MAG: carbohydrate porin [Planctomycetes bacterium]|nr:carbohydrate porin [Planctomycetota bacterium]